MVRERARPAQRGQPPVGGQAPAGVKRMLNIHKLHELVNAEGRPAKRTYELIPTIPTLNLSTALSDARPPEWINEETGEREENDWDEGDALAGVWNLDPPRGSSRSSVLALRQSGGQATAAVPHECGPIRFANWPDQSADD